MMVKSTDIVEVYFLAAGDFLKIGCSERWRPRMKEVEEGSPFPHIPILVLGNASLTIESMLHGKFTEHWVRGEWHRSSLELLAYMKQRAMGLADSWQGDVIYSIWNADDGSYKPNNDPNGPQYQVGALWVEMATHRKRRAAKEDFWHDRYSPSQDREHYDKIMAYKASHPETAYMRFNDIEDAFDAVEKNTKNWWGQFTTP